MTTNAMKTMMKMMTTKILMMMHEAEVSNPSVTTGPTRIPSRLWSSTSLTARFGEMAVDTENNDDNDGWHGGDDDHDRHSRGSGQR